MLGLEFVSEPDVDNGLNSETTSNRWGIACVCCIAAGFCKSSLAKLAMILVHAEKFGGDKTQPIGFDNGIPIRSGLFGLDGKSTANQ